MGSEGAAVFRTGLGTVITPAEYESHLIAVIMLTNPLFQLREINLFVLFPGPFSPQAKLKKGPRGLVSSPPSCILVFAY